VFRREWPADRPGLWPRLALQLSFCFEVGALSGSLMSPAPE
jgi:hypothetical protein